MAVYKNIKINPSRFEMYLDYPLITSDYRAYRIVTDIKDASSIVVTAQRADGSAVSCTGTAEDGCILFNALYAVEGELILNVCICDENGSVVTENKIYATVESGIDANAAENTIEGSTLAVQAYEIASRTAADVQGTITTLSGITTSLQTAVQAAQATADGAVTEIGEIRELTESITNSIEAAKAELEAADEEAAAHFNYFGVCETPADTAVKVVTIPELKELKDGTVIIVKFIHDVKTLEDELAIKINDFDSYYISLNNIDPIFKMVYGNSRLIEGHGYMTLVFDSGTDFFTAPNAVVENSRVSALALRAREVFDGAITFNSFADDVINTAISFIADYCIEPVIKGLTERLVIKRFIPANKYCVFAGDTALSSEPMPLTTPTVTAAGAFGGDNISVRFYDANGTELCRAELGSAEFSGAAIGRFNLIQDSTAETV